ncbi:MAG: polysaccharide deacetylase family protein [Clostridia bacterium]|nr:polysaccharide deacetylase family protein [Clostridia bacterium]
MMIKRFLCILIPAAMLCLPSYAYSRTGYGWYCMRNGNTPPCIEEQFSFIEDYDGYYLDRTPKDKVIYLTFDAGYENGNVSKIAETLKKHNATGAFFVLENIIKKEPELIKSLAEDGNLICNHTASHKNMTTVTDINEFSAELTALEEVCREYTGVEMAKYYRPPEGCFSEENLVFASELGYKTVFWSLAYADWDNNKQPDPVESKNKLLANTHNGMVLLLHPTSATNAAILDSLLTEWEKQGYRFGDLNELCKD